MGPRLSRGASLVALMLLASGSLAACGSNDHKVLPGTVIATVDVSQYELGLRYLRTITPANAALRVFQKKAGSYNKNTTAEQLASDLASVIAAFQEADTALLRADWPPPIAADVKTEVRATRAFVADLRAARSEGGLSNGRWITQATKDNHKFAAAANVVRADLGLPPAKPP